MSGGSTSEKEIGYPNLWNGEGNKNVKWSGQGSVTSRRLSKDLKEGREVARWVYHKVVPTRGADRSDLEREGKQQAVGSGGGGGAS